MLKTFLATAMVLANLVPAHAWETPARGSVDRTGLMDAMRPHAEALFGAPVEFVIAQARVDGSVALVMLQPQRPGGGAIDVARTPLGRSDHYDPEFIDGIRIDALLRKSGHTWVMMEMAVGATDAWYASETFCADYAPVLPEICG